MSTYNKPRYKTHGMTKTKEYMAWSQIKQRCDNVNNCNYEYYGSHGITYTQRWLKFENFYADLGKCPPGMSLDRIDSTGNYEKDNCRWATKSVQAINTIAHRIKNSRYKGVYKKYGKYHAQHAKKIIGHFDLEVDAAIAYDKRIESLYDIPVATNKRLGLLPSVIRIIRIKEDAPLETYTREYYDNRKRHPKREKAYATK